MENELLLLNTEEVDVYKSLNYDELEELLEHQFEMEFSNLEKLQLECKEITSPDKLSNVILDEIWNQFANQIGLEITSETLLKQYNDKNPEGYTKAIGDKILKDKRFIDSKKAMKEKQKSGKLKDEYTGKILRRNEKANLDHVVPRKQIFENPWRKIADTDTTDLANKTENLASTNESLNKSKGAKSNSDYIKNREVREKELREQVKRANGRIDRKNISDAEKRNLKAENNKRLNDKLAADSEKMLKAEKRAKKAINKDIAKKASVRMAKKAGKDAIKASYGRECLTELTKALEDYRDDLVVIVAGYENPMKKFFESNPGLKSRFNYFITFEDYTVNQMFDIFLSYCQKEDYTVAKMAQEKIKNYIELEKNKPENKNANGRFVRNVFDLIIMNQAKRVSQLPQVEKETYMTMLEEDILD